VTPDYGALVVSLDFEQRWGMRDAPGNGNGHAHLANAGAVVRGMLDLFEEFDVAATWATVGFLFARDKRELERFAPPRPARPAYANPALDPYAEPVGEDETADPLHFAPSVIDAIRRRPRQEIATHTFSHYYCLEPGQDRATFAADLASAVAIARASGIRLRSIVFPRNQRNPAYDDLLVAHGVRCYRGNAAGWMYRAAARRGGRWAARGARWLDAYVDVAGPHTTPWTRVLRSGGLCDVPASFFVRPYAPRSRALEPLRLRRIVASLERAARTREIVHLWWHPHNFASHTAENLAFLRGVLAGFARLRAREGMCSLTMAEVASAVRGDADG
jgi:peptidoglycan/xylan/chitin deacetylase (PgdA/CDA1 family)